MKSPETVRCIMLHVGLMACALPLPSTTVPSASATPPPTALAVLSGRVDMASAPPYLNDPVVTGGLGVPVVVVAFHLDDRTWYWVDTAPTHPNYEVQVPAGRYHLVAYGHGLPILPDMPYVAAGYTGMNPSCGQGLVEVDVGAGEVRSGLDIADWNWSCNGTAYRPVKPEDVPVP